MESERIHGLVGIFWIDADNERLFGVKAVPIHLGMSGQDEAGEADKTILDLSHDVLWKQLMEKDRIPDHMLAKFRENVRYNPIPRGRVIYTKEDNIFTVDIEGEYLFNYDIHGKIRAQFNLYKENIIFDDPIGPHPVVKDFYLERIIKLYGNSSGKSFKPIENLLNFFREIGIDIAKSVLEESSNIPEDSGFLIYCHEKFNENNDLKSRVKTAYKTTEMAEVFDIEFIFGIVDDGLHQGYNEVWDKTFDDSSKKSSISF